MKQRVHLIIQGKVQGVCFRMYACREAADAGVTGWIRNLWNGDVEAVAEGEPAALDKFIGWCRKGPPYARVAGISIDHLSATGEFDSFTAG